MTVLSWHVFCVWFGFLASVICAIGILPLTVVQTYYFIVNFQKLRQPASNSHSSGSLPLLVNTLTVFALFAFNATVFITAPMYAQLTQNIMSCDTFNTIASTLTFFGMYLKWIVLILRLRIAYQTSIYEYSRNKLLFHSFAFTLFLIMFLVLGAIYLRGGNEADQDGYILCGVGVPIWLGGLIAMVDSSISFTCMYLFIKPLRTMYKVSDIIKLETAVSNTNSSEDTHKQAEKMKQIKSKSQKKETISDENSTTNHQIEHIQIDTIHANDDNKDIKDFVKKYALLTSVACISSMVFYFMAGITGNGVFTIPDFIFNAYCLALMSHWYDKCYNKMCCGVIKCIRKLFNR